MNISELKKADLVSMVELAKTATTHKKLSPEARVVFLHLVLNHESEKNVVDIARETNLPHPIADMACINLRVNNVCSYRNGKLILS